MKSRSWTGSTLAIASSIVRATGVTCTGNERLASLDKRTPSFALADPRTTRRCMSARPAHRGANQAALLLGDLDRARSADCRARACSRRTRSVRDARRRTARRAPRRGTSSRCGCPPPRRLSARAGRHRAEALSDAATRMSADTSMATPPFMSSAPLPHTSPPISSPPNGGCDHSDGSAATTSTWP